MERWLRLSGRLDRLSDLLGRSISWLCLVMVLIGCYNAVVRYLGRFVGLNLSSNLYLELQWYLFSILFLLGAGWTLKEDAHVRVDVLYARLSERARGWINVLGTALLLVPFSIFVLWMSWPSVRNSWAIQEASPDPGGLPRYPIKTVILVCFVLLLLQAVSELAKEVRRIRTGEPPTGPSPGPGGEADETHLPGGV